jgi:hypothetical protein
VPGGDQDQYAAGPEKDGMDAADAGGDGLSDGLSAWTAGGAAVFDAGYFEVISPDLDE